MSKSPVSGGDNPFDVLMFELKEMEVKKPNGTDPLGVFVKSLVSGGQPYICRIADGSPADKAGLHVGDYVLAVNGHRVESKSQMTQEVSRISGGAVKMIVARRRQKPLTAAGLGPPNGEPLPNFRYHYCRLDPMRRAKFGATLGVQDNRVAVLTVSRDGSAFWSGVQPRDRLLSISGEPVKDQKHCEELLKAFEGKLVDVLVERPADAEAISSGLDEPSFNLQRLSIIRGQASAGVPEAPAEVTKMLDRSRMDSIMKNIRNATTMKKKKKKSVKKEEPPKDVAPKSELEK